jgi:hypothetical protein
MITSFHVMGVRVAYNNNILQVLFPHFHHGILKELNVMWVVYLVIDATNVNPQYHILIFVSI